jgi:hypothetical protein
MKLSLMGLACLALTMAAGCSSDGGEGARGRVWRAYLSSSAEDARDRIGTGPWYNARLQEVAPDVETLHAEGIARIEWFADDPDRLSWNSAHETTGCTEAGLAERQGAGHFYCFAAD